MPTATNENTTDTHFTWDEILLLSKGLKRILHHEEKNWLETLALETEDIINNLGIIKWYYKHAVTKNYKKDAPGKKQKIIKNKKGK
jgi:hypothetical protein